jgi:Holliday junction resolvasome RuvABC endonuclease subunit
VKITGLDLSITRTGICLPDGSTLAVKTDAKAGDRRLQAIRDAVHKAVADADLAVLEEAPPGLRGNAIKAIHMVQGAVRTELLDLCVPYAVVNPSTLKLFATGAKGADKVKMATTALILSGREFATDDECDAFWLREAALAHYGLSDLRIPAAQLRTLEAVVWP